MLLIVIALITVTAVFAVKNRKTLKNYSETDFDVVLTKCIGGIFLTAMVIVYTIASVNMAVSNAAHFEWHKNDNRNWDAKWLVTNLNEYAKLSAENGFAVPDGTVFTFTIDKQSEDKNDIKYNGTHEDALLYLQCFMGFNDEAMDCIAEYHSDGNTIGVICWDGKSPIGTYPFDHDDKNLLKTENGYEVYSGGRLIGFMRCSTSSKSIIPVIGYIIVAAEAVCGLIFPVQVVKLLKIDAVNTGRKRKFGEVFSRSVVMLIVGLTVFLMLTIFIFKASSLI